MLCILFLLFHLIHDAFTAEITTLAYKSENRGFAFSFSVSERAEFESKCGPIPTLWISWISVVSWMPSDNHTENVLLARHRETKSQYPMINHK